jgi:hypothetical protein
MVCGSAARAVRDVAITDLLMRPTDTEYPLYVIMEIL